MATECRIARKLPDGSYRSVVCYYDGYPSNMFWQLTEYFNTDDQLDKLTHRDIAQLKEGVIMVANYDDYTKHGTIIFPNLESLLVGKIGEEHALGVAHTYFFEDGKWYAHYPYRPDIKPMLLEDYSEELVEKWESELSMHNVKGCGWEHIMHPSAEGPSFRKGNFCCQILARNSVNAENAGVNGTLTNLSFWSCHNDSHHTIYLGSCNDIYEFRKIEKLVCNE